MMNAMNRPIGGARKVEYTISITSPEFTEVKVAECAIAAGGYRPIGVREDVLGIPIHQVNRFQKMAAIKPEKITSSVINSPCTVLAMVLATPWSLNIKKATKLNNAAQRTAWNGVNTLVETTVAMELAAS